MDSDADVAWPSAAQAWWTVFAIVMAAFLCTMDRLVLNLLVDPIRADLHATDTQFSLLQGLSFTVVNSIAALPLGILADRTSRRHLLMCGVMVWSVATVFEGLSVSFGQLLAARLVVGLGEAALWPVVVSMIADLLPAQRRGGAVGFVLLGQILGSGASLIFTGLIMRVAPTGVFAAVPVLRHLVSWRLVLVLWGALGLVVLLLLSSIREPTRRSGQPLGVGVKPFFGHVWRQRVAIIPIYVGACCISVGSYSLAAWVPAFFIRHFHVGPARIGPILGIVGICTGILGTTMAGFLADRAELRGIPDRKLIIMMCAALACLPGAALVFAPNLPTAVAIQGISLLFFPIAGTVMIVALQDLVPNEMRGKAMAVLTLCSMLGATIGPTLTAAVTQYVFRDDAAVGYSLTAVLIPVLLIAALCFYSASRTLRRSGAMRVAGAAPVAA